MALSSASGISAKRRRSCLTRGFALLAVWRSHREYLAPRLRALPLGAASAGACFAGHSTQGHLTGCAAPRSYSACQQQPHGRRRTVLGAIDVAAAANIAVNIALVGAVGRLLLQMFGKSKLYPAEECLPGRTSPIPAAPPPDARHIWLAGRPLYPPFPEDTEMVEFGMGCFWCSENLFMRLPRGIYSTAVGYSGGVTPNPTYDEVCGGQTNHAEVVRVAYRPSEVSFEELVRHFWEGHDPTTENRQGNDMGTPYRSAIYCYTEEQMDVAQRTRDHFQQILQKRGIASPICTEVRMAGAFYYAERYHQQYDARGNAGYCGLRPTGASFAEAASDMP
mmetsp:Transcript_95474/g.279205  ORF Transcript_95474/g.279205 Transcript_95474/m.279205 type:complete len:335 (-) Transcript_95474:101-1105(-)